MQEMVIKIGNKELYGKDQLMGIAAFDHMVLRKQWLDKEGTSKKLKKKLKTPALLISLCLTTS